MAYEFGDPPKIEPLEDHRDRYVAGPFPCDIAKCKSEADVVLLVSGANEVLDFLMCRSHGEEIVAKSRESDSP